MSIKIRSLNKRYDNGYHALKDINIDIPTGMFGLLGPNGAGKSTFMRILVALMEPSSGSIEAYGYDLLKQRKEVRQIIGYLPQDFRFFAKYTTYEYLDYAARLSGFSKSNLRRQKVEQMLDQVGLFDVKERYASKLSGGMKRRLGIAQALIHKPKIIVVDEPTTGLDPQERIRFRNLLSAISSDVTIILSTHIVGDISSSCQQMALLNQGELQFVGAPGDMIKAAEGSVWKLHVNNEQLKTISSLYPVITTIPQGTGWEIQCVAQDGVKGFEAESIMPNLEHAYVYYMEHHVGRWMND